MSPKLGACGRVPGSSFHLSPSSFHFSPRLAACGRVPGWLVSRFLFMCFPLLFICFARPLLFICLPVLFICLPGWVLVDLSSTSFHLSPKLGACGRVPGWLVSHFLSFVFHFFSLVSQFFSFVSQAGCLWSGSQLACLPTSFHLSLTSFHLSPTCFHLSPSFFNCLPGWALAVGFPAGLPLPLGWALVSGRLVSHFLAFVSNVNSLLLGVLNSFLRCVTAGVRPFPLAM